MCLALLIRMRTLCLASLLLLAASPILARFAYVEAAIPIDRLLKNFDKYVADNPKDARGYYVLGRLHALAFAGREKGDRVRMVDEQRNTQFKVPAFGPTQSL